MTTAATAGSEQERSIGRGIQKTTTQGKAAVLQHQPHPTRSPSAFCYRPIAILHLLRGWGLGLVRHASLGLVLGLASRAAGKQRLAVGDLLVLLDEIAEAAAARHGDVGEAASLEVVLLANVGPLHRDGDEGKANGGRGAQEKALSGAGLPAG